MFVSMGIFGYLSVVDYACTIRDMKSVGASDNVASIPSILRILSDNVESISPWILFTPQMQGSSQTKLLA